MAKKKIESLTQEQIAMFPAQIEKWTNIGLTTGKTDKKEAEEAIRLAYKCAGMEAPKDIYWEKNPVDVVIKATCLFTGKPKDKITQAECQEQRNGICFGQFEAGWLSYIEFFKDKLGVENLEAVEGLIAVSKHVSWWIPYDTCVVACGHPTIIERDDRFRLHSLNGPALAFDKNFEIYAVHGVNVPKLVITNPEKITLKMIEKETNAEVRRVMMERFGLARYLQESKAVKIHSDDFGTLWKKEVPNDEPLVMVQLINSTKEPDGTNKNYFLRVPPTITTARQAVAWTFGKDNPKDYSPEQES